MHKGNAPAYDVIIVSYFKNVGIDLMCRIWTMQPMHNHATNATSKGKFRFAGPLYFINTNIFILKNVPCLTRGNPPYRARDYDFEHWSSQWESMAMPRTLPECSNVE